MSLQRGSRAALAFVAVTCVLAPVAYVTMFSLFNAYDDEGYFLLTLRDYLSGQALYTQVSSIYGPFFYETVAGLFRLLGLEPGNDNARFVTLGVWLVTTLVGGLVAYRLTHNLWLAVGAQFVTFHVLTALGSEPIQPAGLIGLLLMCLAGAAAFRSAHPRAAAVLIGAIVGALCLVKVNVGSFAAVAVVFAFASSLKGRWRRFLLPSIVAVMVLLPLGLMASQLSRDWVLEFALVVAIAGAAVGTASLTSTSRCTDAPSAGWLLAGGVAVVVACLGVAIAGGTQLGDLVNGLVLIAWKLPQVYVWPIRISPLVVAWAVLGLAAAISMRVRAVSQSAPAATPAVQLIAGLLTWTLLLLLPSTLFLFALPLAWLAMRAPRETADDSISGYARLLLPALAVLESLQAYPVAGTQLSLGALVLVPIGAMTLGDGISQLGSGAHQAKPGFARLARWAAPAALLLSIVAFQFFGYLAWLGFAAGTPMGLRGAAFVRVKDQRGADLRAVVVAVDRECSNFITFPGMPSFYLWTGQKPPAQLYSPWMFYLDGAAQQSAVQQIENRPRLCVVKNQAVIDFWSEGRPVPRRPLVDFIQKDFVLFGTYGDYELLVRADQ